MKILLISQDNSEKIHVGGKHIHQNLLVDSWRKQGHEVRTIFPRQKNIAMPIGSRIIFRLTRGWTSYPVHFFSNYLSKLKKELINNLSQSMKDFSPDIISAQDPIAAIACAEVFSSQKHLRPRITLTLHGYYTWEMINYGYYGEHNKSQIEEIGLKIERKALEQVEKVITVDSRIRDYLRKQHHCTESVDVIFNAINIKPFHQLTNQEVTRLKRKHASQGEIILLVARRLVLKNGVHVAISALAALRSKNKNIRLILVGGGPEESNLKTLSKNLGLEPYIDFIGAVEHEIIHDYYKAADIVLMPSIPSDGIEEATSLSMLEGMAAGKLVICSAIGGMKEIISHQENGYLVEPNDSVALSEILEELLNTPPDILNRICSQARKFAFEHHDSDNHAKQILIRMNSN